MRNDYKVICEKKYYVVFTDGQGKEQKIEIPKVFFFSPSSHSNPLYYQLTDRREYESIRD